MSSDTSRDTLSVVQVNTHDEIGGAARLARELHTGLNRAGVPSRFVVGYKRSSDASVTAMDSDRYRNPWSRSWLSIAAAVSAASITFRGKGRLASALADIALPARAVARYRGIDYFGYPAAWHPEDWRGSANLLHLHNLHGGYLDLRALSVLSASMPTVITLHDAWLLAGHCGHSLDCERWRTGCGNCPDLSIPPAIRRDGSGRNWQTKRDILASSKLYVVSPSRWLMNKVQPSILGPAVAEARVIPNGVDLEVFRPQDKRSARAALGIAADARVLIFAANGGVRNPWKDFSTIREAAVQASLSIGSEIVLLVVGGQPGDERMGDVRLCSVGEVSDRSLLARYLAAADVSVHAVKADNFSLWLSESLACGTPCVTVRVGGIPEVVQDGVTGFVVEPGDPAAFGRALVAVLTDDQLRDRMSKAGSAHAASHLGLARMVDDYRRLYHEILDREADKSRPGAAQDL
jgi:glycosyltransferase involved in cell wall biosynthesis